MIRVLQCVNDMHRAGLETMLMNYYRHMDRSKIQFDFLTHRPVPSDYDEEIRSMGGKVYYAPRLYPQNYISYFQYMSKFFKEHTEYKIVHSHIDSMSYLPLLAAKKSGIPIRIAHSHNTSIERDFKIVLKYFFKTQLTKVANYYCACGQEAGEFLFQKKDFKYIPNAIEADNFIYNLNKRNKIRKEYGWENHFIVGHVGRLTYQKNHRFLVNIFKKVYENEKSAILVLIGVGEKEKEIREQVKKLNLTERVKFLGNCSNVNELYQGMDVFVMPSHFEGIPVVGIEAQFASLPIIFSNKVPEQVKFTKKVDFLSLDQSEDEWVRKILMYKNIKRAINNEIINSEYNIKNASRILEDYYTKLMGREIFNEKGSNYNKTCNS